MSSRSIAKNRFHKGLTAYLRRYLRRFGISLDEEMAQFALGGTRVFDGVPDEAMTDAVNQTMSNRSNLMTQWEAEHPNKNPFAPSFPERALKLVRAALQACYDDDASPAGILVVLQGMCEKELETEPVTTDYEE